MRCTQAQKFINDYVDHLLGGRKERRLIEHLKSCSHCRDLYNEMKLIVDDAKHLTSARALRDIWPGIKNQMAHERRKTTFHYTWKQLGAGIFPIPARQMAAFATLFLVIGTGVLFYFSSPFLFNRSDTPESAALIQFREAETQYKMAIDALNQVVVDQGNTLPPELFAVFKKNLDIIDTSIRNCQAVIQKHPDNIEANNYLLICYRKKMDLLNDMRELMLRSS